METEAGLELTLDGLVHDLNNVFEAIAGAAALLDADAQWAVVAAAIRRSVTRGQRILSSYIAGARGKHELDTILDNAIDFARDLFRVLGGPPVDFVRNIQPGIRLGGPAGAWERVLLNLFLNAAEAMPQGGLIEVTARKGPDSIEISISDTGPGIPPDILPRLFQPRFSTKPRGSGLGLHIVKTIVQRYGGVVSAGNRHDRTGAAVRIRVPAGPEDA